MHGSSQRIAKMMGYNNRMPNTDLGECLFVKTHKCAMLTNGGDVSFQRALVLYRKPSDNLQANLRYLTKLNNRLKGQGKRMLSESCSEGDSNNLQEYGEWEDHNSIDYHMFVKLHHVAHQRFYCLAEQYPIPKMIVTYNKLLNDPCTSFRNIMGFIGHPNITESIPT